MRKVCLMAMGLLIAMTTGTALGGEPTYSREYETCMDKSGGVTVEMLNCIAAELGRQDAKLNRVYKELREELSPARKKELLDVQRLWIKYRDANCGFYDDPDWGTIAGMQASECILRMTAERADELERLKEPE